MGRREEDRVREAAGREPRHGLAELVVPEVNGHFAPVHLYLRPAAAALARGPPRLLVADLELDSPVVLVINLDARVEEERVDVDAGRRAPPLAEGAADGAGDE